MMHVPWEPPALRRFVLVPWWHAGCSAEYQPASRYAEVLGYAPTAGGLIKTLVRLDASQKLVVFFDCELSDVPPPAHARGEARG